MRKKKQQNKYLFLVQVALRQIEYTEVRTNQLLYFVNEQRKQQKNRLGNLRGVIYQKNKSNQKFEILRRTCYLFL